jgi:hypothetical protein
MWLIPVALIGLLAPGGLFLFWMVHDYSSLSAALTDRMAMAFFLDLLLSTFLLSYFFAHKSLGPVKWPWFLALSLPLRDLPSPTGGAPFNDLPRHNHDQRRSLSAL